MSMADVELGTTGKDAANSGEVASLMNKEEGEDSGPAFVDPITAKFERMKDFAATVLVIGGIVLSLACMGLNGGNVLIYIPQMITLLFSPYVAYQRNLLRKAGAVRSVINQIREDVNRVQTENDRLVGEVDKLEVEADNLKSVEAKLDGIVSAQGGSVSRFMELLKESKDVTNSMKAQTQGNFLQSFLKTCLDADRDDDYSIDPDEIDGLIMNLEFDDRITFDENEFRERMKEKGYGINAIMDIIDDLFDESVNPEHKVFKFANPDIWT